MRSFGSGVSFCSVYVTSKIFVYLLKSIVNVHLCEIRSINRELRGDATLSRLSCRRRYVILDQQFLASSSISSNMFPVAPQKFPSFGVEASSLLFGRPNQAQTAHNRYRLLLFITLELGQFKKWLKFDSRKNSQAHPILLYHAQRLFMPFLTTYNALIPVQKCVLVLVTTEFG